MWLAANTPENVLGIVLEDPPLFSSEYPRIKTTVSWDGFITVHDFLQSGGDDFLGYYVLNSHAMKLFRGGEKGIYQWIQFYRKKRPGQTVEVFSLPASLRFFLAGITTYDPLFGMTFYDGSWNRNFDHAQALSRVACPAVLIHANWFYDYGKLMGSFAGSGGMLMGAMDGHDAARAAALMKGSQLIDVRSGHGVHVENPKAFIGILQDFGQRFPKT